jgi:hypothetical protein
MNMNSIPMILDTIKGREKVAIVRENAKPRHWLEDRYLLEAALDN